MASAKKGKKNKGKTIALSEFLQEAPGVVNTQPIRKSTTNWADEVEDSHDLYESRVKTSVVLPTAPKASRDYEDIIDKVPQDPPYVAYLSNLPYDVDETEIAHFFRNMKIANMRIPKDERPGEAPRLRGFGYVEFEDRNSLLNALVIPDTTIKTRRIRIDVATDMDVDRRRPGGRMDMNRDRNRNTDSSSFGDWRSGPRQESSSSSNYPRSTGDDSSSTWRSSRSDSDRPFARDTDRPFTRSDRDSDRPFTRDREFNRDREDRPITRDSDRPITRDNDRPFTRDRDNDRPFSRDRDNDRPFTRDRDNDRPFSRDRESDRFAGARRNTEPRSRPKLMLTPRTVPIETGSGGATAASIFGDAKPVDTAARERQIEERLATKKEESRDRNKSEEEEEEEEEKPEVTIEEKQEEIKLEKKADLNGVVEKEKPHVHKREHEKKESVTDKPKPEIKKKEEKKEKPDKEKEMPKLKKTDPPNFVASNKFAFLENEDSSD